MIELLIIVAIAFYLGYRIGQHVMAWQMRFLLKDMALKEGLKVDENFQLISEDETPKVSKLYIEKEQGNLYLYDYDEEEFVCQSTTIEGLAELAKKYKNIKYAAVIDGDKTFMFVDGNVKPGL